MMPSNDLILKELCAHQGKDKYFNLLSMIYTAFLMAATVMAYKVVEIWGMSVPGSTLIYSFTFFLGNIIAEVYGKPKTNKLIWESIIVGYIFALLIALVNGLSSPRSWDLGVEFHKVLGNVLRFTNAGIIGYLLSAFLNAYLITKWKYQFKGKYFWIRSLLATSLSEGLATFIAGFITFFGMMANKDVAQIMFNAFLFKIAYGLFAVWPASFIAYVLMAKENNA